MRTLQQSFAVRFEYAVHFTADLFAPNNPVLAEVIGESGKGMHKLLCVVDGGVLQHNKTLLDRIAAYCRQRRETIWLVREPLVIPGGETAKTTPEYTCAVQTAINHHAICRQSFVMAIGGGAVLDMVGFAAATSHRGVRLIRVPTTVLSQNDSGVGVKNGINGFGKKNFIGAFAPPFAVINDSAFLTTLSDRDWISGAAEAVKVALIKDADFFWFLEANSARIVTRDLEAMEHLIHRCAELHLRHIGGGDPFELGSSRPLDFGHWAAHKLEQLTNFRLRHGEAVALGIALDSTYSHLKGMLPTEDWRRILALLSSMGFALYLPEMSEHAGPRDDPASLFHGLIEFREHLGGPLTVMLLEGIGKPVEVHEMDEQMLRAAIGILAEETGHVLARREVVSEQPHSIRTRAAYRVRGGAL